MSQPPFVALSRVQTWRVLAYLTSLERSVVAMDVDEEDLPMWAQFDEIILGLDGLGLTIDAVRSALDLPDEEGDGGGGGGGDRVPRNPRPGPPGLQIEIDVPQTAGRSDSESVFSDS